ISFVNFDANEELPFNKGSVMFIRLHELYDDLGDLEKIVKRGEGDFRRIKGRLAISARGSFLKKDGSTIDAETFARDYWARGLSALEELDIRFLKQIAIQTIEDEESINLDEHPYGDFLRNWTSDIPSGTLVLNLGAARNLQEAVALLDLERGAYLRISDYGFISAKALGMEDKGIGSMAGQHSSGQTTALVNFPLLQYLLRDRKNISVELEDEDLHVGRMLGKDMRSKRFIYEASERLQEKLHQLRNIQVRINLALKNGFPSKWVNREELIAYLIQYNREAFISQRHSTPEDRIREIINTIFDMPLAEEGHYMYHLRVGPVWMQAEAANLDEEVAVDTAQAMSAGGQDGFIRNGEESTRIFESNKDRYRTNDVSDDYQDRLIRLAQEALERLTLTEEERGLLQQQLDRLMAGDYAIYGYESIVVSPEDYFLGTNDTRLGEIFIATDLVSWLEKRGPPGLSDEYLRYKLLDPVLGHYPSIFAQQKLHGNHYQNGTFQEIAGLKYLEGFPGHTDKPFKGELGAALREYLDRQSNNAVRSTIFRHQDGLALMPVMIAFFERDVFSLFQGGSSVTVQEIIAHLKEGNEGYIGIALNLLVSQGWMDVRIIKDDIPGYTLNERGRVAVDMAKQFILPTSVIPLAMRMDEYLFSDFRAPPGMAEINLDELIENMSRDWGIPEEKDPLRKSIREQLHAQLNGTLVGPVMVALGRREVFEQFDPDTHTLDLTSIKGNREHLEQTFRILAVQGWIQRDGDRVRLTPNGLLAAQKSAAYGVTVSYLPTFALIPKLLFEDPSTFPDKRDAMGHETWVDRNMNVWGSGGAHLTYFKKIDEIIIDIFNRPIEEQPQGIADMGCGNGTFLEHLYHVVMTRTRRGELIRRDPEKYALRIVGADFNQQSRERTHERLLALGIDHAVVHGDINDPDAFARDLLDQHGISLEDMLSVRSFLDHNRPYTGVLESYHHRTLDSIRFYSQNGRRISAAELQQNLVEHFKRSASYVKKHGLLILELHGLDPRKAAKRIGRTLATPYDATHGFSDQYTVELENFDSAAEEAGLKSRQSASFPSREFATVSIDYFLAAKDTRAKQKPKNREAVLADLQEAIRLAELEVGPYNAPVILYGSIADGRATLDSAGDIDLSIPMVDGNYQKRQQFKTALLSALNALDGRYKTDMPVIHNLDLFEFQMFRMQGLAFVSQQHL
ncbi:MAG: class I SAM-dependent methyltransferase, partial [Chlamydiota bacterium]|nr:class I SAM-dependent methyltransferase [Chlamydiota bacterium]